jgi:acyl-coenzyme A synthetase/AMP-(fatty) acid ligase
MNLVQTLRQRSELQPGVPALIDPGLSGGRILTYSGLNRLVDYLSFDLHEKNIGAGDRVLIGISPSQEMYGYVLAALEVGAIPILCDRASPHDEFIAWMSALEPKGGIIPRRGWVGSHFDGVLKNIPSKIFVGRVRSQARGLRLGKLSVLEDRDAKSPALISLVHEQSNHLSFRVWSQEQLQESIQLLVAQLKLKAGEIDLCSSPLHLLANLAAGLTSMIATRSGRNLSRQVEKFKPTRIAAGSPVLRRLLRKPGSPLHKVFITDAPIELEDANYFADCIQRANIELVFCSDLPLASVALQEYEQNEHATLVGSFFPAVEARVAVRDAAEPFPESVAQTPDSAQPRKIGELLVRGAFLPDRKTLESLAQEGATELTSTEDGWRAMGVFGYFDDESRFWLTRRAGGTL